MVKLEDSVSLRGRLCVHKVYTNGEVEIHYEEDNLITDYTKALLMALVYDTTATAKPDPVRTFGVGKGGVSSTSSPGSVVDGTPGMTSLRTPLNLSNNTISHNRSSVTPANLSSNSPLDVTFTFGVANSALIGEYVSEAGLFTQAGKLFSYKSFPALLKTDEFSLQFTWTITYV